MKKIFTAMLVMCFTMLFSMPSMALTTGHTEATAQSNHIIMKNESLQTLKNVVVSSIETTESSGYSAVHMKAIDNISIVKVFTPVHRQYFIKRYDKVVSAVVTKKIFKPDNSG